MEYVIVGGGISGLYSAYSLHKKFNITNITVIEKNNRLGGRIDTLYVDGVFLEMGAGGIVDVQKNVIELLQELELKDKMCDGSNGRSLVIAESVPTSIYSDKYNDLIPTIYKINNVLPIKSSDFYDIIGALTNRLNDPNFYEMSLSYNLYMLVEKFYGFEKASQLMYQFGYHADFLEQNSVEALQMFQKEFSRDAKFYRINGGMSQIIQKLAEYLERNKIKIRTNSKCIDIEKCNGKYICLLENNRELEANNIIFAIPKMDIIKIGYFRNIFDKLNSVIHKPLLRIYVFFPLVNGKVWFDDINMVLTTKTLMNQIVPVDNKKGILMIYCDSLNARAWHHFSENGILERELMFHLTKLFSSVIIPKPTKIYISYHDSATHVWKPSINPIEMYEDIVQPISGENIFIVGEAYSLNQQWSEGAIQSVKHLMGRLEKLKNRSNTA